MERYAIFVSFDNKKERIGYTFTRRMGNNIRKRPIYWKPLSFTQKDIETIVNSEMYKLPHFTIEKSNDGVEYINAYDVANFETHSQSLNSRLYEVRIFRPESEIPQLMRINKFSVVQKCVNDVIDGMHAYNRKQIYISITPYHIIGADFRGRTIEP